MTRDRRLVLMMATIFVLVIAEGILVATVFLVPSARGGMQRAVASATEAWSGTEERPGIPVRLATSARGAYRAWIAPLWASRPTTGPPAEFADCLSCHPDYASKQRFSATYMNHPLHAQLGVACADCHEDVTHPDPLLPAERSCEGCHDEVTSTDSGDCVLCHPPGSLPHYYLLGMAREGPVTCGTCHPTATLTGTHAKPLVPERHFDGSDPELCASCHPSFTCERCHADRHPEDWGEIHGRSVADGGEGGCFRCHAGNWCADRCHSVVRRATTTTTGGGA